MRLHRFALAAVVLVFPPVIERGANAFAADPVPDSSLRLIPADAAFYSTSLRLGEQMQRFLSSNAYAKLKALPAAKYAAEHVRQAMADPNSPPGQAMQLLKDPANKELVDLLTDLAKQEIFIYGGAGWTDLLPMFAQINSANMMAAFQAGMSGQNPDEFQKRAVLQTLNDSADKIAFPELVIGFKLSKTEPAMAQLKRLEGLLTKVAASTPLKGKVKRVQVAGADALSITVDSSLVPMDKIPWSELEQQEGQYQNLRKRLKSVTLAVSLLVKDDYLLLTVGPTPQVAAKLGQGAGLTTRSELAPLAKFADRKLVSVSYSSKTMAETFATKPEQIDTLVDMAKGGLDKLPLPENRRTAIDKDLKRMADELKATLPKPGAGLSFAFLTDHGQESYSYDYGTSPNGATPKPLTILDHLGGSPLLAVAGRINDPTPGYRTLVKWIKTIHGHIDAVASDLAPGMYQQFQQGMDMLLPFLKKFDEITGNQFLPALGEGELALVIDAKWTSKQWIKELDQNGKSLPLPELGLVRTVADGGKLLKAFQAYRDLVNEIMSKANDFGANLPPDGLPKPEAKKLANGTAYFWSLNNLPDNPFDKQVQPNFGLSDKLIAFSLSVKHSDRLMTETPLKIEGGPVEVRGPVLAAAVFDFGGFVQALRPWVEQLALPAILQQAPDDAPPGLGKKEIPAQVKTVLDVLGCLRTFTSVTYREGTVTVTHSEMVIRDLE
jgi:hypothetical protein